MRIAFILGWGLLGAAFLAAAAEAAAHAIAGGGLVMSAYDVWHTLSPVGLFRSRLFVENTLHPMLWNPVVITLTALPGWLTLGAPGAALAWLCRPRHPEGEEIDEESFFLFDALEKRAVEDGYGDDPPPSARQALDAAPDADMDDGGQPARPEKDQGKPI